MNLEKWKPIPGWEGLYEASNLGRIRSCPREGVTSFGVRSYGGEIIKPIRAKTGYMVANFIHAGKRKQVLIHRCVLLAFIGEPRKGQQACHNNGDRADNRLANLRWDSIKSNHADKKSHGTWQGGENNPIAKLTDDAVRYIRSSGLSNKSLAKELGVSVGCIDKAKYKQTWKHI